jgi:hypothetical protein
MGQNYNSPETAPRDGTEIVGYFERDGQRPISLPAAYKTGFGCSGGIRNQKDDIASRFAPLDKMIGWRPKPKV